MTSTPKQRANETHPARLGSDVAYMAVLLIVTMLVSAGVVQNQIVELMPATGQEGVRIALSLILYALEIAGLSYCAFRHRTSFGSFFRLNKVSDGRGFLYAFVALIGLRLLGMGWTLFADRIGWVPPQTTDVVHLFGTSSWGIAMGILNIVILAPFIEELIFRGLFQKWCATKMPAVAAIIVTAVFFTLYHLSFWAALMNLLLGITLGFLAQRCKTLWPAITLHVLYNATVYAAALYLVL